MAYKHTNSKGVEYILHYKDVELKGGKVQRIYFFAREEGGKGTPTDLPDNKEVVESARNGFLVLKNKA